MLRLLQTQIVTKLKQQYPDYVNSEHLIFAMNEVFANTGNTFVVLVDEWNCLFREYQNDKEAQKKYLDFLRIRIKPMETTMSPSAFQTLMCLPINILCLILRINNLLAAVQSVVA